MKIEQGDVFKVDLGYTGKIRFMVVVSRTDQDPPRALVLCAPITTKFRGSEYEIELGRPRYLRETSYVNLQGIVAVQWADLIEHVGRIESTKLEKVKRGIRYTFDT